MRDNECQNSMSNEGLMLGCVNKLLTFQIANKNVQVTHNLFMFAHLGNDLF